VLSDPLAVELVDRIDYPFVERFGEGFGQVQGLRTRCFDRQVRRFLQRHPAGTVVALGEGLETQFWRVDNGAVRWVGVDLPEVEELRRRLLPAAERVTSRAESALDLGWLEELAGGPALVTAQGLLMYLRREEVDALVRGLADSSFAGDFVFDAMPPWLVQRSRAGKLARDGYTPPTWEWALDDAEARRLATLSHRIATLRALPMPRPRPGVRLPAAAAARPRRAAAPSLPLGEPADDREVGLRLPGHFWWSWDENVQPPT
jgi:O-methyltransferase involved in polyketide biosynthesis